MKCLKYLLISALLISANSLANNFELSKFNGVYEKVKVNGYNPNLVCLDYLNIIDVNDLNSGDSNFPQVYMPDIRKFKADCDPGLYLRTYDKQDVVDGYVQESAHNSICRVNKKALRKSETAYGKKAVYISETKMSNNKIIDSYTETFDGLSIKRSWILILEGKKLFYQRIDEETGGNSEINTSSICEYIKQ